MSPYFDSPIDLLCIGSLEGIFQKLNPEWETTPGYTLAEPEGRDFTEFVHPATINPPRGRLSANSAGRKGCGS